MSDEKDEMTGKSSFIGLLRSKVTSNGRIVAIAQVVATCGSSELNFEISSFDVNQNAVPFRAIQGNPTIIFNQIATPQPVVSMRVSIDAYLDTLQVPVSQGNVVKFPFHGMQSQYDDIMRNPRTGTVARLEAQGQKQWAVDAILKSQLMKFELPLANGQAPILYVHPQDPTFRVFVDRCNRERSLVPSTPSYQLEDKRFAGTVDEFVAAFPGALAAAAANAGLDARKYAKAAEIVVDTVRTCARITPAMGQSVAGKGPRGLDAGDQLEGGKYAHCFSGNNVMLLSTAGDSPAPKEERGITLMINPPQGFPGGWVKGNSFGVEVFFPEAAAANPYLLTGQGVETIMRARVDRVK